MSNYVSGRRAEYEASKIFKEAGWTVTRAASSKGPFDLVATKITSKNTKTVYLLCLMQVKKRQRKKEKRE